MRAYSTDLRERVGLAYESGAVTLDEVTEEFGVGRCTVARLLKLRRAGRSMAPRPHGGGRPAAFDPRRLELLRVRVGRRPDDTLTELAEHLRTRSRVSVHLSTVCRALQRLGLPRKKASPPPSRSRRRAPPSAARSGSWTGGGSSSPTRQAFI